MKEKRTAGLILAAGRSSRMGRMKMLLPLGSETVLRTGVLTMLLAGVSPVIVVTGREAEAVRESLSDLDVIFVHNKDFETTQMLDSVKIGLSKVPKNCERVLFAPGDVSLYSKETVLKVMNSDALYAVPVCDGKRGHPVSFSTGIINDIIKYDRDGGLAGALKNEGAADEVLTEDYGTLMDADTEEDYEKLLTYYDSLHLNETGCL